MRLSSLASCLALALAVIPACATGGDVEDGENDSFSSGKADSITDGSAEARAVLALVNDTGVDFDELDNDAGLSSRVSGFGLTPSTNSSVKDSTGDDETA